MLIVETSKIFFIPCQEIKQKNFQFRISQCIMLKSGIVTPSGQP